MKGFHYDVDAGCPVGENRKFWAACGTDSLYPLLFTDSGERLLKRMQEKGTCRYMRNHHTLSSLAKDGYPDAGGDVYSEDPEGRPIYHFEKANKILKKYLEYGIKPVVELDFLPDALCRSVSRGGEEEGVYLNRSYPKDWNKWHGLLKAFVRNLSDTFGTEEIRSWYFEVWNEADGWPVEDWPQFHRMYDIFVDAVLSVDEKLRVGGPGSFRQDFLHDFLEHAARGRNHVTGARGTRVDFISYHIYGMSGSWLKEYPLVAPAVQRFTQELMWLSRLIGSYPELKDAEFHLNEWGVCSHYEKNARDYPALEIRNSEFSACFFVKLVDCIQQIRLRYGFEVTMLLYWGFCLEDDRKQIFAGNRDLMTWPHLPKPVLTAFELMAKMGPELFQVEGARAGGPLGCMAAGGEGAYQLMLYHFEESEQYEEAVSGSITVHGLEDGAYLIRRTELSGSSHNAYRIWKSCGSPEYPEPDVLERMAAAAEPDWDSRQPAEVKEGVLSLQETLAPQTILLLWLEKTK